MTQEATPETSVEERYSALALFLARTLVPEEDVEISVNTWLDDSTLRVIINVPEDHRGRLIGRNGHMIRSLRTLAESAKIEPPHRVELDIAD